MTARGSTVGWQKTSRATRRRVVDLSATAFGWVATAILVLVLGSILWTLLRNGLEGLSTAALLRPMGPPGSHGGLANAIVGSLVQTFVALLIATPIGLGCGIYLAEFGNQSRFAAIVRFVADILLSAPSILVGLFVYLLLVAPFGHFSGIAGSVALAILAVPIIIRTTEDMLNLVPTSMREAGAALGAAHWRVVIFLCLRSVRPGVLTGILLALARVSGRRHRCFSRRWVTRTGPCLSTGRWRACRWPFINMPVRLTATGWRWPGPARLS